jgi:hypothetical protein
MTAYCRAIANNGKKITAYMFGGLGSQLFIIFTTLSFARRFGYNVEFIENGLAPGTIKRGTYWPILFQHIPKCVFVVKTKLSFLPNYIHFQSDLNSSKLEPIPAVNDWMMLHGHFQSYQYFHDNISLKEMRQYLLHGMNDYNNGIVASVSREINHLAQNKMKIFIHLRRDADFVVSPSNYIISDAYYMKAIEILNEKYGEENVYFIVFSDNMSYAKELFGALDNAAYPEGMICKYIQNHDVIIFHLYKSH